ncbi:MAG: ABC transporter ATP-binding protein [Gammaproteobacteria bacterium]|jgi:ABC-type sugar transport system ATPase subunit|nr:ABC transporter ATP-binding protein [Gammaproteobacteria bacterium]
MSPKGRVSLRGIRKEFGRFVALDDIDLDIEPVEFFALLGPSGSGKTTTLRLVAGLDTPDEGTLTVDGVDVTFAPPGERDVAMVFQNYALYPHMTVRDNIAFPLKMAKAPASSIDELVREAAAKVRIDHLLHRRPGQLSGGQQQRCALARAIVRKPKLFLLDEPLSNLDAQLRLETRVELKKLQRNLNVTAIYVTHDQEEAMTLADRMAIFLEGTIKQIGTPAEVFDHPNCVEVAAFIGSPPMNIIPAALNGRTLTIEGHSVALHRDPGHPPGPVIVGIRPGSLRIDPEGIPTQLYLQENMGETWLLNLKLGEMIVKMRVAHSERSAEGETVPISFAPGAIHLFDAETGLRVQVN